MKRARIQKVVLMAAVGFVGFLISGSKGFCNRTYKCPSISEVKQAFKNGQNPLRTESDLSFYRNYRQIVLGNPQKNSLLMVIHMTQHPPKSERAYLCCVYTFGNFKEQWNLLLAQGDRAKTCKIYAQGSRDRFSQSVLLFPDQLDSFYAECSE